MNMVMQSQVRDSVNLAFAIKTIIQFFSFGLGLFYPISNLVFDVNNDEFVNNSSIDNCYRSQENFQTVNLDTFQTISFEKSTLAEAEVFNEQPLSRSLDDNHNPDIIQKLLQNLAFI